MIALVFLLMDFLVQAFMYVLLSLAVRIMGNE